MHARSARATCARASRTWCSATCASRPAWRRTCTCRGSTRTRSAASRSSARSGWRRSTTWSSSASSTVYDKGFDRDYSLLRRVHRALGRRLLAARLERGAAADRVRATSSSACATAPSRARAARVGRCAWCACSRRCSGRSRRARVLPGAELQASERAPGLLLGEGVELPDDVEVGRHVVVHAGTVIGAGRGFRTACVVGKPLALGARSSAAGAGAAGTGELGDGRDGRRRGRGRRGGRDRRAVRDRGPGPRARARGIGARERGRAAARRSRTTCAIGARVRMQTGAYVTAWSVVEDDVFIAPGVITTNDPTAGRRDGGVELARRRRCGARAGSARAPCSCRASRSARRRSWPRASVVTRDVPAARARDGRAARGVRDVRTGSCSAGAGAARATGHARLPGRRSPAATLAQRVVGVEVGRVWRGSAPLRRGRQRARREEARRSATGRWATATCPRARTRCSTCSRRSPPPSGRCARSPTRCGRARTVGPFRNLRVGRRHIHHFVPGIVIALVLGRRGDPHARRAPRAGARGPVRSGDGPDARRVGAPARARGRVLDARGPAERADHADGDGDARRTRARRCASCGAARSSCSSRTRRLPKLI